MTKPATIESMHITGRGEDWKEDPKILVATMNGCLKRFIATQGRCPSEDESMLMWVATQRFHHVPENAIEPAGLRRQ
ncbi:hypothetical protein [Mesorhizobium sp. WSM3873]|uniref:hypothetical protein n=1 Tax=Mesorhizobium sp. WSM3873 TaxID=1854056 RepID=UPI0008016CD0|nr:hypothetical protein [Mesorhizobium sp. WSM3873]OBQ83178.1 hypothetical protein A9K71_25245 [Mesorhizobium sp. WSM3873]